MGTDKDKNIEETAIVDFLQKRAAPYSEPHLMEELFNIKIKDGEDLPELEEDLNRWRKIKSTLKELVAERKIFAANFADRDSKEQVLHYSTKGWYATP